MRRMMNPIYPLLGCLLGASCSQELRTPSAPTASEVRTNPENHRHGLRAPFVLSLGGREQAETGMLALTAQLRGQLGAPAPVDLEILLPPGVRLIEGRAREQVQLSPQQPVATRQYVVSSSGSLRELIRVRARLQQDPVMGAIAERVYPEPTAASASPHGAPTTLGRLPIAMPTEAVPVR